MSDAFAALEDQDVDTKVVLDYTSRDFTAIRAQLVGIAKGLFPEWETAGEASDFGTLLIEIFAYMGDVMHFYIDRTASEAFLGSALRRQSVLYIADMLGYIPMGQQAAGVTLEFVLDPNAEDDITIPVRTRITNSAGNADSLIVFELDTEVSLEARDPTQEEVAAGIDPRKAIGYATEGITVDNKLLGYCKGAPNTEFRIPDKGVIFDSLSVRTREGGQLVEWQYMPRLVLARPTQNAYTTYMDESEYTYIVFGDNAAGRVPPVNAEVFVTYRYGVGVEANLLVEGDLDQVINGTSEDWWGLTVSNPNPPVGGTDPETVDAMRQSIPRAAARIKNRAITLHDYADLALQVPGVVKSMAYGTVYTYITVRIAPVGGVGEDAYMDRLCTQVEYYMADKVVVGSTVVCEPRTILDLWWYVSIRLMVHVQEGYNRTAVRVAVDQIVRQVLAFDNVDFGTRISIGQIYRSALAVQGVEWVDLLWLNSADPDTPAPGANPPSVAIEKSIIAVDDNRVIGDIVTDERYIPKIDPTSVTESEADFPDHPEEEERTHDGLWVHAVGGLPGT